MTAPGSPGHDAQVPPAGSGGLQLQKPLWNFALLPSFAASAAPYAVIHLHRGHPSRPRETALAAPVIDTSQTPTHTHDTGLSIFLGHAALILP